MLVVGFAAPWHTVSAQDTEAFSLFFTDDYAYSVILPAGWYAQGSRERGLVIGSSEDTLNNFVEDIDPAEGQFALSITTVDETFEKNVGITPDMTPLEGIELAYQGMSTGTAPNSLQPIVETTIAGQEAAGFLVLDSNFEGYVFAYNLAPNQLGFGIFLGKVGAIDAYYDNARAILNTVRFSLPLPETFEGIGLSVQYPSADWVVLDQGDRIEIALRDENATDPTLATGEFDIFLLSPNQDDIEDHTFPELARILATQLAAEDKEAQISVIFFPFDEYEGAWIKMETPDVNGNNSGLWMIDTEHGIFLATYSAPLGDEAHISLTALTMLDSLVITQSFTERLENI